jgi:hypothetical protein
MFEVIDVHMEAYVWAESLSFERTYARMLMSEYRK